MSTKSAKEKAYDSKYQARPEQVENRMARNRARAALMKKGIVHKGDGKEVDHKKMIDSGGSNAVGNLRAIPAATNRAWRKRNPGAYGKK